jgi:hypothetical protein
MKTQLKRSQTGRKARKTSRKRNAAETFDIKWTSGLTKQWLDSVELVAAGGHRPGYGYGYIPLIQWDGGTVKGVLVKIWHAICWIWSKIFGANGSVRFKDLLNNPSSMKMLAKDGPSLNVWCVTQVLANEGQVKSRPITNVSGLWKYESVNSKVTADGAAGSMVCLRAASGQYLVCGIAKTQPGTTSAFVVHLTPTSARATDLIPLPKASSYVLEADVAAKTGQTTFWVNDVGINLGKLNGLKGGATSAYFAVAASCAEDHLPSGRFANCAVAKNGKWETANLTYNLQSGKLDPHQEVKILAQDSVSSRDLRSRVA